MVEKACRNLSMSAPSGQLSRSMAWALALTATLTMAVSYMDRQALAVLAPTVTKDLHISDQAYGWLISAFSFAYLVGAPIAGYLIDRIGARRGLFFAVLLWSVVAALHALVPSFALLLVLRIALGLAEAPSFPGAAQTIHRALPRDDQPRAFGVLFTGSSLGAMLAPPIATFLEARFNYRIAFLGTALAGLIWIPIWVFIAFRPKARAVLDQAPAAEQTDAIEGPEPSAPEESKESPLRISLRLLGNTAVLRAVASILAMAPMLAFALNWAPKYLFHTYGLKQNELGIYLIIPPLLFDAGAVAFGHFASLRAKSLKDGSSPRLIFALAVLLTVLGGFLPLVSTPFRAVIVIGLAMGGGGALSALMSADMLSRVHPKTVSAASGIVAAAQSLAYIVANPLIGLGVESVGGYPRVMLFLGLWVLPGSLFWLLVKAPPMWSKVKAP